MQMEKKGGAGESSARGADSRLNAFLIYEDVATGKKAKESCDVLARKLGLHWKIDFEMSSFKLLCLPRMRRLAAGIASQADLVIYSCRQGYLPAEVCEWTETCLTRPIGPTALVALLAGPPRDNGEPPVLEQYLAGVAKRLGMNFFSHLYTMAVGNCRRFAHSGHAKGNK
jgi:hypothetical protein